MKRSLLAETWSFLRGRPDHPIYRREMRGWVYLRAVDEADLIANYAS